MVRPIRQLSKAVAGFCAAETIMTETSRSNLPRDGKTLAWLKLMRLPTVFTALTNILCGYLISTSERDLPTILSQPELWLLLLSSAGLYLGGMVLNDVFDADLDARQRPERPIPSGRISRGSAGMFGGVLVAGGVAAAGAADVVADSSAVRIAVFLAAAVVLYDALLKNTVAAPLGMGLCRFLNVMLGAGCSGNWTEVWTTPQILVAGALGLYVIGVTWFAQNEAGDSSRGSLLRGLFVVLVGLLLNAAVAWQIAFQQSAAMGAVVALGLIAMSVGFRSLRAVQANEPRLLQKSVGFMLLNIIFIDAAMTFCFTGSGRLATLVVILVIPATLMKRVIPMS